MKKNIVLIFFTVFVSCEKNQEKINPNVIIDDSIDIELQVNSNTINKSSLEISKNKIIDSLNILKLQYYTLDKLYKENSALRDSLRPFFWELCPKYYELQNELVAINLPTYDSIKKTLISNGSELTQNQLFINSLLKKSNDTTLITIEKAIAPIFNLKKDSVGAYNSNLIDFSDERLLKKTTYYTDIQKKIPSRGKTFFYKHVLDSLYTIKKKYIYLYSTSNKYESQVLNFGKYADECLEYYYYDCKVDSIINTEKQFMFTSPFQLDLAYVNDTKIDSLVNTVNKDICLDCPSDWNKQKTYARLKEFENLYFTFAFKSNSKIDKINTPLRALYYVKESIVFSLWIDDIDLFGCGCL